MGLFFEHTTAEHTKVDTHIVAGALEWRKLAGRQLEQLWARCEALDEIDDEEIRISLESVRAFLAERS